MSNKIRFIAYAATERTTKSGGTQYRQVISIQNDPTKAPQTRANTTTDKSRLYPVGECEADAVYYTVRIPDPKNAAFYKEVWAVGLANVKAVK